MKNIMSIFGIVFSLTVFAATTTQTSKEYVDKQDNAIRQTVVSHANNTANPHGVTPRQIGAVADDESYASVTGDVAKAVQAHQRSVVWYTPINTGVLPSCADHELMKSDGTSGGAGQFNLATLGMINRDDTIIKKAIRSGNGFDGSVYTFDNLFSYTSEQEGGLGGGTRYTWYGNFLIDWSNIVGDIPGSDRIWDSSKTVYQDVFGGVYEIDEQSIRYNYKLSEYNQFYSNVEWRVIRSITSIGNVLYWHWVYGDPNEYNYHLEKIKTIPSSPSDIQTITWKWSIYLKSVLRESYTSSCEEDDPKKIVFELGTERRVFEIIDYSYNTNKVAQVLYEGDVYSKEETDDLIAACKPEWEDVTSNVVWRLEADGARFFMKPVRPVSE